MAFEALPGSFLVLKPDPPYFTILAVSDELLSITGQQRSGVIGRSVFEIYPVNPNEKMSLGVKHLKISLQNVVQHKKADQMPVTRYDLADEKGHFRARYWLPNSKPIFDNKGELLYIIHSTIDVTSRVQVNIVDNVINGIENVYHLFMQAPVAICVVKGPEHIVELVNAHMLQFLGRTEAMAGKPIQQSLPEAKIQGLLGIMDNVRKTGETLHKASFPATVLIDGIREQRYFDLVFKPYFHNPAHPTVTHIFCVAHNVTAQVLARRKIEESEQQVRSFIESAPFPIGVYIGREMRIQFANGAILEAWGKGNDVFGRLYSEVLPELDNQEIFEQLDSLSSLRVFLFMQKTSN